MDSEEHIMCLLCRAASRTHIQSNVECRLVVRCEEMRL